MSQTLLIESINYNGEIATVLFKPDNANVVINLGNVVLPYLFDPSLLNPPREIYGTYTILVLGNDGNCNTDCPNILQVPRVTPTPTPTLTITRTLTPTVTPTISPTPTFDPCKVPTQTPTTTSTPTITPTHTPTPSATCTNPCGCPEPSNTPRIAKTPRPTPSITSGYCYPTPTPTPTIPLLSMSLIGYYSPGSINVEYQLFVTTTLNKNLILEFSNTLYFAGSDPIIITGQTITISRGQTQGFTTNRFNYDYYQLNGVVGFDNFVVDVDGEEVLYQLSTSYSFQVPIITPTNTPTKTATPTPTITPTKTVTPTVTPTPTNTPSTTLINTPTPTNTLTNTPTVTPTNTLTNTPTNTVTPTPTNTETPTNTPTITETPTNTPTITETPTNTPTNTPTITETPTNTPTNTVTPTITMTNTVTQTPTPTPNIVVSGLIMQLDANKTDSYPGTGTTVFDLTGSYDNTLSGGSTFTTLNGIKCFDCSTGNESIQVSGTGPSLPTSGYTYVTWARIIPSSTSWRSLIRTNNKLPLLIQSGTDNLGFYDSTFRDSGYDVTPIEDVWVQYAVVGDNTSSIFYINGTQVGTVAYGAGGDIHVMWGNNLLAGQSFGYLANLYFYDRKLSFSEINQMYNFLSPNFIEVTPTPTITPTNTVTPTITMTNTVTPTPTITPTITETPTNTPTTTNTQTPTVTPTITPTRTQTPTFTPTRTLTPTNSLQPTTTPTNSLQPTTTPTNSLQPTTTPTNTLTPTITQTQLNYADDSIYNALSASGKTAYLNATLGDYLNVSETDYLNVLNNVLTASIYGAVTFSDFTGSTLSEFGSPNFISDSTQVGLNGNSYVIGFAVRGSRTGAQGSYTVGVRQTTGSLSGGTYSAVTNNVSFTNTVAGGKTYFIRKSPQESMSTTSYLGIYFSMNITQLNMTNRLMYYNSSGTPPFSSLTSRPPAAIFMVASSKTW